MAAESDTPENPSSKSENSTSNSCEPGLANEASSTSTSLNNELYRKDNADSSSNSREAPLPEDEDSSKQSCAGNVACSYSDFLVKEVLAAKETLKKYLGKLSTPAAGEQCKSAEPTPKSRTERRQGTSFEASGLAKFGKAKCNLSNFKHRCVLLFGWRIFG